jgi:DNA-binding beta-propeller fold protein YncE
MIRLATLLLGLSALGAAHAQTAAAPIIPPCVPIGLAVDSSDELYVANHFGPGDCGGTSQILVYNSAGTPLPTRTISGLTNAAGLAFDSSGNLYAVDAGLNKVFVYNASGTALPAKTLTTDAAYSPSGVQVDSSGNVWVANRDTNDISIGEVQIFKSTGITQTITQNLEYPLGIAFAPTTGNAWIGNAERPFNTLTVLTKAGAQLHTFATSGFSPAYVAFGPSGDLYATNAGLNGSEVEIFNTAGTQIGSTITDSLNNPYGIAFTSTGDFYVANLGAGGTYNGSSISKFNSSGTLLCVISGCNGCISQAARKK